jgi:CPA1 family monovalent cation:H+ antiporter
MVDIALVLTVTGGLLVVVAMSQPLAAGLKVSPAVLLAVIGVAIGVLSTVLAPMLSARGYSHIARLFAEFPIDSKTLIGVFLPLLVFEAAIASDVRRMAEDAAPILVLAVVATLITSAAVGFALWPFAGVPLVVCLLLGATVATTDPAAVISVFRDVGAPARLTRLIEGEALLNDAAAIALFAVLLGMIVSGRDPDVAQGAAEFGTSFLGGGLLGLVAGRSLLQVIPWTRDDRLAETTLTIALAYLVFVAAEKLLHVSGVVAVLASGLTVNAFGRARINPHNWDFLRDLWDQIAFWSRSLIFVLASILVPKLLVDFEWHDLLLCVILIVTALAVRLVILFVLLPPLSLAGLTQPISTPYKLAIAWGGLRGALTLVLALAVTENQAMPPQVQRFVAVLATGLVLFTLLVNGTTLRPVIKLLGLDRLSPIDQVLRDQVLASSYAEMGETVREIAAAHDLSPKALDSVIRPYEEWISAANARDTEQTELLEQDRLTIGLVALANQERVLVLRTLAQRSASPDTVQVLLRNAERLIEAARNDGRLGYKRAIEAGLSFPASLRFAYVLYRRLGIMRLLANRLGDRYEMLLVTRLLVQELLRFNDARLRGLFGMRLADLLAKILRARLDDTAEALDALRRQYPDYAATLETRFLRQSALRQEMGRYQMLFEEGLIAPEVYVDLQRGVAEAQTSEQRPRFDLGLDTRQLITRLDLFSSLDDRQLDRVLKLLRPRFTVPGERIVRKGERGDAVYFIASGAAEVVLPGRHVPLGSGDIFGEMALISGEPRRADVVAATYCRLLVLRKSDFDRFMRDNRDVKFEINRVAEARRDLNRASRSTGSVEGPAAAEPEKRNAV